MKAADLGTEAHAYAVQREIDELADGRDAQLQERVARSGRERHSVEADLARRGALGCDVVENAYKGDTPLFFRQAVSGELVGKKGSVPFVLPPSPFRNRVHREAVEADGKLSDEPGADELGVQRRRPFGKRAEQAQEPLGVEPEDA